MNDMRTINERQILFTGDMVRAILDGRKTQTRRIMKPQPSYNFGWYPGSCDDSKSLHYGNENHFKIGVVIDFPKHGIVGDRLWVKETFREWHQSDGECSCDEQCSCKASPSTKYCYRADGFVIDEEERELGLKWTPSIFMPRAASRINLEITGVRVEPLQDISEEDAGKEGVKPAFLDYSDNVVAFPLHKYGFRKVWKEINGAASWDKNPWVWVIEFKRV